jgi:hypothetical protein
MVEATIFQLVVWIGFALILGVGAGIGLTLWWQRKVERDRGRVGSDRRRRQ